MKSFIACACLLLLLPAPASVLAQAPDAARKSAAKKVLLAKARRIPPKSVATDIISSPQAALSPAELALADLVHVGRMPCELGAFVTVTADPARPGYFHVEGKGFEGKGFRYHMAPVPAATGVARLEDPQGGAVWLQIANKSMLMNQRLGRRLADECMSHAQMLVAETFRKNPPVSLLEPLPGPSSQEALPEPEPLPAVGALLHE